ncbi:MAG: RND family efflux transporter MFP subunit [Sulfurimonas sp.]|jgi:RND family efflux transporter MFP subunit|uniref:efflux RND transporter periplasmic adaptor subunit n=1 Tax=Sulfurimonas sp. TaxID=2022749 RepID=UPI0039E29041
MAINKFLVLIILGGSIFAQDTFIGVVKPKHNIKLSLPTDGTVHKIVVKEGSYVKKGNPLIVLDNKLQKLETQRRKMIWEDKSRLNSGLNEEKILSSLYKSTKELYESSGGISKSELQSLEIKYYTALGQLKFIQANEKQESVEYKIAKKLLDQLTLYSPISGVVTKINIDLGEFAKNTEPILSIVDSKTCFVELNVDKDTLSKIKKNQLIAITTVTDSNKVTKKAKIIFISPIADSSSGLFFVKAEFSNKKLEILPGLTVTVSLK